MKYDLSTQQGREEHLNDRLSILSGYIDSGCKLPAVYAVTRRGVYNAVMGDLKKMIRALKENQGEVEL